jgi:copper chaperone NosL
MRYLLTALLVFCVVSFASAVEPGDKAPGREKCPVCGMFVSMFADWNSRVEFKDFTHATFDGSKCMFKYYFDINKYDASKTIDDVAAVFVKDFYSKTDIYARQAHFVIWGDLYGPMGHEPIPFEKKADAKRFLKEHKGKKILRFNAINPKLILSLDNP